MKIFTVGRWDFSEVDTVGFFRNEDGNFRALSMELPKKNNLPDVSCILKGEFIAEKVFSHHLGYPVWELKDVPGRTFIEVHPANWVKQLLGCIAIGYSFQHFTKHPQDDMLQDSKVAFDDFMELTQNDQQIKFVIEEV